MSVDDYTEKLRLLESIVCEGITRLLTEAREKEYLEEPFGRAPAPTPLISEEQFVKSGGTQILDSQNLTSEEPNFDFNYGFHPLEVLSKFVTWSHPNSVEQRKQGKLDAVSYLNSRAQHADCQLNIGDQLVKKVQQVCANVVLHFDNLTGTKMSGSLWHLLGSFNIPNTNGR